MADLRQGRIVWVELTDPQGRNPKVRPAVVLTPTELIRPDGSVHVVAITGETTATPAEQCVALPWLATGHPKTGLNKPNVAVVSWVVEVPVSAIKNAKGLVPTPYLLELLDKVGKWNPKAMESTQPPASSPPSPPPPPDAP